MKSLHFGIEVEMTNITRMAAAKIIAKHYGTNQRIEVRRGYDAHIALDNKGREWKAETDASIMNTNSRYEGGCEVVSPILNYDDIEDLQQIIRDLRAGGAVVNGSCGIHVHVGAENMKPQHFRNLVNIIHSKEDLIYKALQVSDNRAKRWCKKIDAGFFDNLNKSKPNTRAKIADLWYKDYDRCWSRDEHYNSSRYHGINFHATFTKGSVEFRLFNATLHAGRIKAYVQFCMAVIHQAMTVKKASKQVAHTDNEKYTFRCWLLRLGLIGDEFKTCRSVLLHNLTGNSAWRHGQIAA